MQNHVHTLYDLPLHRLPEQNVLVRLVRDSMPGQVLGKAPVLATATAPSAVAESRPRSPRRMPGLSVTLYGGTKRTPNLGQQFSSPAHSATTQDAVASWHLSGAIMLIASYLPDASE